MAEKATNIEKLRRTKTVVKWILDGHSHSDIVHNITQNWGLKERQAKEYIAEAFKLFKEEVLLELEENRAFHLKARMESYKELVNERAKVIKNRTLEAYKRVQMIAMLTNQINAILRDMAKIGGLYVDKIDHTTNGKSIKPTIKVVITPN